MNNPKHPVNFDVLSPTFEQDNTDYNAEYNYVGSDWFYQNTGLALDRHPFGVDINRAAYIHDFRFENSITAAGFREANKEFRSNIIKLFKAAGKPVLGRFIAFLCWCGVSGLIARIDYFLCKKNK